MAEGNVVVDSLIGQEAGEEDIGIYTNVPPAGIKDFDRDHYRLT